MPLFSNFSGTIRRLEMVVMPLGMIGVVAYLLHTILGRILWPEYNPITTDISSLTAIGAPNRDFLMIFSAIYWNILGLTERAVIYALQLMMFIFSAYYTFSKAEKGSDGMVSG